MSNNVQFDKSCKAFKFREMFWNRLRELALAVVLYQYNAKTTGKCNQGSTYSIDVETFAFIVLKS